MKRLRYRVGCMYIRGRYDSRIFLVTVRINETIRSLCIQGREDEEPFRAFKVPLSSKDNVK